MRRSAKILGGILGGLVLGGLGVALWEAQGTERDIRRLREEVTAWGARAPRGGGSPGDLEALPPPVRRYLAFALPGPVSSLESLRVEMEGTFRRPRTSDFAPASAVQVIAPGRPAFVFSVTTWPLPVLWARAYDGFVEGHMVMRAKLLSCVPAVDEGGSPELDRISLRRWLLESPLCPAALLPGGPVRWEPLDDAHARAVVSFRGMEASLVASFRPDGSLESFRAEEEGDLTTPYHGSGELVVREDYRLVQGMRVPFAFTISRVSGGRAYPFWSGRVTGLSVRRAGDRGRPQALRSLR